MNKSFLFIGILFLISSVLSAQTDKQFMEIDYQLEIKMDLEEVLSNVPSQYRAAVQENLRQELSNGVFLDYKLKTNGSESEYKMQEKLDNSQDAGGMIAAQIASFDKEPLYKNIAEKYYLKPYAMMGVKSYLVKDSLKNNDWKITREKKEVAGFDTYKATGIINDSIPVTAWYAPKLSIKDGPDRMWGLPGMVLKAEFEMQNMEMVITAMKITVEDGNLEIKKPEKGKVVTEKEFMEEMEALRKKFKEMYGEGVETD